MPVFFFPSFPTVVPSIVMVKRVVGNNRPGTRIVKRQSSNAPASRFSNYKYSTGEGFSSLLSYNKLSFFLVSI